MILVCGVEFVLDTFRQQQHTHEQCYNMLRTFDNHSTCARYSSIFEDAVACADVPDLLQPEVVEQVRSYYLLLLRSYTTGKHL